MDIVGVGIVGSGFMGLTYAEVVARHVQGARLAAIARGRRAGELAREHGVAAEPSTAALFGRRDVHAVILATPDQYRLELTRSAAAAGKHVLAEKPMAPTVAECDAMIAACADAGVRLAVVKTERFRKITRKAKQLIDEGVIGPVQMMRTVSSFPLPLARQLFEERPWMADPRSGGLFMGMATHNADFLRWLAGADAIRVFARAATYSDLPAPAQSVMAHIEFASGVMAQMWITSELAAPGMPASEVRFQIAGRDGALDLENFEFLDLGKGDKWERIYVPEKFDYLKEPRSPVRLFPHIGVVQEFVDSVREGRPPLVGGAEGRAAVEICEACLISARTGKSIDLPLTGR